MLDEGDAFVSCGGCIVLIIMLILAFVAGAYAATMNLI